MLLQSFWDICGVERQMLATTNSRLWCWCCILGLFRMHPPARNQEHCMLSLFACQSFCINWIYWPSYYEKYWQWLLISPHQSPFIPVDLFQFIHFHVHCSILGVRSLLNKNTEKLFDRLAFVAYYITFDTPTLELIFRIDIQLYSNLWLAILLSLLNVNVWTSTKSCFLVLHVYD